MNLDNIYHLRVGNNFILNCDKYQILIIITRSDIKCYNNNITAYYESRTIFNDNVDNKYIYNALDFLKNQITIYKNSYFIFGNNKKMYCTMRKIIFADNRLGCLIPVDFPEFRKAEISFYIEVEEENLKKKIKNNKFTRFELMEI